MLLILPYTRREKISTSKKGGRNFTVNLLQKMVLLTLTVCLFVAPAVNADDIGTMALPMALLTGAGLQGDGNGTGIGYSWGSDGGDWMQTFSYDMVKPWQLLGRKVRAQAVWTAPLSWWGEDINDMNDAELPGVGAQLSIILLETHLIPGLPGDDTVPPKLPTTVALSLGGTFNLEREQLELHCAISLVRFLF